MKKNTRIKHNNDSILVLKYFFTWRILLFAFTVISISILSLNKGFLGGGLYRYLESPYLWSWLNFDGVHYLSIARGGYQDLTYFFFPLFPFLTRLIAQTVGGGFMTYVYSGLLISQVSFVLALIGFWKLILKDYDRGIAVSTIVLLLLFPTSFYFGSYYTESLFLCLVIWTFYFARQRNWLVAGLLGALASSTRLVGVALFPALLIEYLSEHRSLKISTLRLKNIKDVGFLFLIPLGLLFYMYYLYSQTGDSLEFFNSLDGVYGEQRSTKLVLLPQVLYRYIFKILPAINYNYFPVVFTTYLELLTALMFGVLVVMSFLKLRISYSVYFLLGYIVPTLSGSFSSLPRYVLVLFPAFMLSGIFVSRLKKPVQLMIYTLLFVSLGMATALFVRGYWVS